MAEQNLGLGIDTGGTFTDAAIVDVTNNAVVAAAKSPTTRHDLAVGIEGAMRRLPPELLARVGLVSLSTTLATNAIVEGNGAPICLVLLGYDEGLIRNYSLDRLLPTANIAFVAGGHRSTGEEATPLDEAAIAQVARRYAGQVAAFAVSGFFAVRNPEHELRARDLLAAATGLPVTCGHELASELDSVLRAATCALNGSLVSLLRDLMLSVQRAMAALGIDAPLMVVRGDGSLMRVEMALERPVETILSGPAASVVGSRALTLLQDMLVVDIGGTTTDVAVVRDGLPQLNNEGARVGRWRTLVRAVQTTSIGLGGDSQVGVSNEGALSVGPRRVIPLAFLSESHPEVRRDLARMLSGVAAPSPEDSSFFAISRTPGANGSAVSPYGLQYSDVEQRILKSLSGGPRSMWWLAQRDPWAHLYLSRPNALERTGVIMRCGFTPTDALHMTGGFVAWDTEASRLGARLLGRVLGIAPDEVAGAVLEEVQRQLIRSLVPVLGSGGRLAQPGADDLLMRLALGIERGDLEVALRSRLPIVGIGAPADHFVAPATRRLNAEVHLPEHHDVANAVGAICGSVVVREVVQVIALYKPSGLDGYVLTGPFSAQPFESREEAMAEARQRVGALARQMALAAGATEIEVAVVVDDQEGTASASFGDKLYLGSAVTATAVGRPRFAHEPATEPADSRLF